MTEKHFKIEIPLWMNATNFCDVSVMNLWHFFLRQSSVMILSLVDPALGNMDWLGGGEVNRDYIHFLQ